MAEEKFLIDSNALITPHLQYYPFDLAPSFWRQMEEAICNGTIAILDMVKAEVLQGTDELCNWMDSLEIGNYVDRRETEILAKYAEVLTHIQSNPCYKEAALHEWSRESVADPWLIATAAVYGYTIVTLEKPNANLHPNAPAKNAKIPDVAQALGVQTKDLFLLMRSLNFRL